MRERTRRCRVDSAPEQVWDYLSDYRNLLRLVGPECAARLASGVPGVQGARYSGSVRWEDQPADFTVSLDEAVPDRLLVWRGWGQGSSTSIRIVLEPSGAYATDVTATMSLALGDDTRPLEPFGWVLLDRMFDRMMTALRSSAPAELRDAAPRDAELA